MQAIIDGIVAAGIYALVAIGLTLILGLLDVANFAHGQVIMVGAYVTYWAAAQHGLPFLLAVLISIVAAALFGVLLERTVFRRIGPDHLRAIAASIGVIMIAQALVDWRIGSGPRTLTAPFSGSLRAGSLFIPWQRFAVFCAAVVLIAALLLFMRFSRGGLALRAMADDWDTAGLMGVSRAKAGLAVFGVGSALAGAGGALLASLYPITPTVGDAPLFKAFIIVIIGGLGSARGVVVAALILGVVESVGARYLAPDFVDGYSFLVLIAVLLLRPNGLFGVTRELRL